MACGVMNPRRFAEISWKQSQDAAPTEGPLNAEEFCSALLPLAQNYEAQDFNCFKML